MEVGEYEVQGDPQLHTVFQASAGYKAPFKKIKIKQKTNKQKNPLPILLFIKTLAIESFTGKGSNAMAVITSVWKSLQIVWGLNSTAQDVLFILWVGRGRLLGSHYVAHTGLQL